MAQTKTAQEQIKDWYQCWVSHDWDGDRSPHSFLAEYLNYTDVDLDPKRTDDVHDVLSRTLDDDASAERFLDWLKLHKAI